ncbi:MAG: hypothetical protein CMJ18_12495 [Phycisphaeraceae bacterium]|nr:hypothetical protein [Phycisphaeraceae bacterium]
MARLGAVTPQSFELGVTIFASDVFEQWGRFVVKQLLTEANGDPAEKVKPDRGAEAEEGETAEP